MPRVEAIAEPRLLAWARARAGYTVEEAAHRLRVDAVRLAEWEVGSARPTVGFRLNYPYLNFPRL